METSARRLGNEVSAGNTDIRRVNVHREQGRRARLIDTVTEKQGGKEKIERGCEGACEGIKENRCIGMGIKVVGLLQRKCSCDVGEARLLGGTASEQQLNIWLMCFSIQKIGHFRRSRAATGLNSIRRIN